MFCHLFCIFLKSSNKLLGQLARGTEELVFFVCNSHVNKKTSTSISLHISCLFLGPVPKLLSVAVCMSQIWCYRIIGVGRDVWRSSSTASLLKQVPLECSWISVRSLSLYCIATVRPTQFHFPLSKISFGEVPMLPAKTTEGTSGTAN